MYYLFDGVLESTHVFTEILHLLNQQCVLLLLVLDSRFQLFGLWRNFCRYLLVSSCLLFCQVLSQLFKWLLMIWLSYLFSVGIFFLKLFGTFFLLFNQLQQTFFLILDGIQYLLFSLRISFTLIKQTFFFDEWIINFAYFIQKLLFVL